jgi:hypothetical protein
MLEAEESVESVPGDERGFILTRSEVNKTPWHVNISNTLLKEVGCSQSQPRDIRISSSASSRRYDLLFVSISRRRQLF